MNKVFDDFVEEIKKYDGKPTTILSDGFDEINKYQISIVGSDNYFIISVCINTIDLTSYKE